jgi:alcohol dehydrogenase/propanol-preferring alcohol dehydrogenase
VAGKVVAVGPDATGVAVGDVRVVYPWLGCGHCDACKAEQDNMCTQQHAIGVIHHGGFGSHVVVPHARYLIDPGNVDPALAATYACSGITTYSAISKLGKIAPDAPVVVIGAGGVGLAAVAMLKALGHNRILSVDTAADKRAAAAEAGAEPIDGNGDDLAQRLIAAAGDPIMGVLDCVNNSATARAGFDSLGKGGTLVPVGVAGGEITLSLAALIFRINAVRASNTGTLQDLRDVIALANAGKLKPSPVIKRPVSEANEALQDLKHGRVTGRQILVHDCADH